MICYRDMTFCDFWEECGRGGECSRALTEEACEQADKWWESFNSDDDAPVCTYINKPECFKDVRGGKMTCKKCGTELVSGIALDEKLTGIPDFVGDDYVCTLSPSGQSDLIKCLKCPRCGWSVKGTRE